MTNGDLSAVTLSDRFVDEQTYIQKFVQFFEVSSTSLSSRCARLLKFMDDYDLVMVADVVIMQGVAQKLRRDSPDLTAIEHLRSFLQRTMPIIAEDINHAQSEADKFDTPQDLDRLDIGSLTGECVQYLLDATPPTATDQEIDTIRPELIEQLQQGMNEGQYDSITVEGFSSAQELVAYAAECAKYVKRGQRVFELTAALDDARELDMLARMASPESEINMYRQGFLSLMTVFDATIFDLAELAFEKDFFTVLKGFLGDQSDDKVALKEFARQGSFTDLRRWIIEEQLRGKYLKELLAVMVRLGAPCVETASGRGLGALIELVNRRNVHIHNRGRVDRSYLGIDAKGGNKPTYNFYNLTLGDVAIIDSTYWEYANDLCGYCVRNLAAWVDSLGHH